MTEHVLDMDDLGRGGDEGSLATGNAGARYGDDQQKYLRQKYLSQGNVHHHHFFL